MQDAVPFFHAVSQSYKITFKTLIAAKLFQQTVNQDGLSWTDPRDRKVHPLRVRADLPVDVRSKNRRVSEIYQPLKDLLTGSDKWTQDMRLGVNGFKGT
eukprot:8833266-Pyramimonas_sp.AAC.1